MPGWFNGFLRRAENWSKLGIKAQAIFDVLNSKQ
jgi:hypothetical protein